MRPAAAVVGGSDASGATARGAVMVLNARGGVCSGTVLGPDIVLTAAHCVAGGAEVRVHWRDGAGEPVLAPVAARAVHPGYDAGAIAGRRRSIDLALVRLADPLPDRFTPASLAPVPLAKGDTISVLGYGVSREGEARTTGTLRSAALAVIEPYGPSRILVWASDPSGRGAGLCEGDSGGPVVAGSGDVVAVATWASGTGRRGCGDISQGTLVGPQRDWIDRTLAAWDRSAAWR